MNKCYKVRVVTTNSSRNTTKSAGGTFVDCLDSELFVLAEKPSDIEMSIHPDYILSIDYVGLGYMSSVSQ